MQSVYGPATPITAASSSTSTVKIWTGHFESV